MCIRTFGAIRTDLIGRFSLGGLAEVDWGLGHLRHPNPRSGRLCTPKLNTGQAAVTWLSKVGTGLIRAAIARGWRPCNGGGEEVGDAADGLFEPTPRFQSPSHWQHLGVAGGMS